jgi:putative PEP-CTERM system TPR-repeat lipoprotein
MALTGHGVERALRLAAACGLAAALLACGESPEKLLASARDYLAKGDTKAAIIQLKNALQAAPDSGEARLLLGKASLETRDYVTAEKELRLALEQNQPADAVLPLLATAMMELGHHEALIRDFGERKIGDAKGRAVFQAMLGDAHMRLDDRAAAATAYAAALAADPENAGAQLGLVALVAIDGRPDEALAQVDRILAQSPKLARAHGFKADLLLAKGDRAGARKSLEAAIDSDPHFLPARLLLIGLLTDDGEFDAAAGLIDDSRKLTRGDPRFEYEAAMLSLRRGDLDKARQEVQQLLKMAPEHVPSLVLAGAIDLRDRQPAAAEISLSRAVAKAPGHAGARQLLVQAYLRMGQPAKAREALQPLIEKGMPTNPQLLLLAGETYLANGDAKAASGFYRSAAAAGQAQGVAAKARLGQLALATGRTDEGFRELETAAELDSRQYQADLAIIAGHLQRNETDKAMAAVKALEKKQPKNPLTFLAYGMVHMAKRDVPAARRNFDKALELQPNYLPAAHNLAMLDLAEKRPDDARRRYEAMIARDDKNDQLYLALAELQARAGDEAKAIGVTLQRAVDANPRSVPARLALVEFHLRSNDPKAAAAAAQSAAAALPNSARIIEAQGMALEAAGEIGGAIEAYGKAAAQPPQVPEPLIRLAALYMRQKDTAKAIDALLRAKKIAPSPRDVVPQLVQAYSAANRPDDALREVRDLQRNDPKFAAGYVLEGDLYAGQRKFAQAEKPYREALRREPKADGVAVRLHRVLADGGKTAEADAFARTWMAENPKNPTMQLYLGGRELAAKNYKAAAAHYQAALAADPDNASALNNLAWVGIELGDPKALGYAERAVKLAPGNPAILDTYGVLLLKKGEAAKALEPLGRAAALAPRRHDIRLNYAKALAAAGRKDEARRELEALLAVIDDFPGKGDVLPLMKSL